MERTMPDSRFRFHSVLAVSLLALALSGCSETYEWNEKVTVIVETPQGEKTGASVTAMKYTYVPQWQRGLSATANVFQRKGEAVAVEVKPGRYLFALTPREIGLAYDALHKKFGLPPGDGRGLAPKIAAFRGTVALDPKDDPILVTFANLSDPTSVRQVEPDDLAATFGLGYALKAIKLEVTQEPATAGMIDGLLGWLGPYPEPTIGAPIRGNDGVLYRAASHGDFIRR